MAGPRSMSLQGEKLNLGERDAHNTDHGSELQNPGRRANPLD